MTAQVSPFTNNPDGSREFVCTDCRIHVIEVVATDFDFPVCSICRFIGERPQLTDEAKAILRGER